MQGQAKKDFVRIDGLVTPFNGLVYCLTNGRHVKCWIKSVGTTVCGVAFNGWFRFGRNESNNEL